EEEIKRLKAKADSERKQREAAEKTRGEMEEELKTVKRQFRDLEAKSSKASNEAVEATEKSLIELRTMLENEIENRKELEHENEDLTHQVAALKVELAEEQEYSKQLESVK